MIWTKTDDLIQVNPSSFELQALGTKSHCLMVSVVILSVKKFLL